jgi:Icc-related predicted phosphoesterase
MIPCFFVSDLHGKVERYLALFRSIQSERPAAVFLGGDLLPSSLAVSRESNSGGGTFLEGFLFPELRRLRESLEEDYPRVLVILGNDDPRTEEALVLEGEAQGLWTYLHGRSTTLRGFLAYGYSFVPPTPFMWKDWERYDVSRYVPPGSVSPEEGWRTVEADERGVRYGTIQEDLAELVKEADLSRTVLLLHSPPYDTLLDRAALDGKSVDHVPLDLHVGSIAIRRFIEKNQPLLTLHGHIHESARLTGSWRDILDRTHLFSAAHDGPELALVRFDLGSPGEATRTLL